MRGEMWDLSGLYYDNIVAESVEQGFFIFADDFSDDVFLDFVAMYMGLDKGPKSHLLETCLWEV